MKDILKRILFLFSCLVTLPLVIGYKITKSKELFLSQGQLLSLLPGKIGSYVRIAYYRGTLECCPAKGYIGFGSFFSHPEVEIGTGYHIGEYCNIGMARIGCHATIGSGVHILSGKNQHGYEEIGKPVQEQPGTFLKIAIGENCWIGNGAILMADLGIQNVVAAGSVVTSKTGDYEVLAGNPAKVIKIICTQLRGKSEDGK